MFGREDKYWRLTAKRPQGFEEVFDLRNKRQIFVGDDESNDICLASLKVPFHFPVVTRGFKSIEVKLTEETIPSIQGDFQKQKEWKTRLYKGSVFSIQGPTRWTIGEVEFELKQMQTVALDALRTEINPLERKHAFQSFGYTFAFYAAIFLIFSIYAAISSLFPKKFEELAVQKITVAEVEKVFKKPAPVAEEIPTPVEEKTVKVDVPQKPVEKPVPMQQMAKAPKTQKSAAGKTGGAKPRNVKSMGLLAIQSTPGNSRVAMALAAPQVIDRMTDAKLDTSLGLGKAVSGIGIGDGDESRVAKLGSISGKSYQGGLGDKLATARTPSIALARKEVEVRGALDPAVIRQIIEERLPEIRYCYENALLKNTDLAGKISAAWTIQPNGTVANIISSSEEIRQGILHPCIREQINHWKFPIPKGGGVVHVKYPFLFNPVGGTQ